MRRCTLECDFQQYIPKVQIGYKNADNVKFIDFSLSRIKRNFVHREPSNKEIAPNAILQSFRNEYSERSQENEPSNAPPLAP